MKRIKALDKKEFEDACSSGEVYGQYQYDQYKKLYVYIKLGIEEEYIENPRDNPQTNYRFFRNCTIEYSTTEQQIEEGMYQFKETGVSVILYW